MKFRPCSIVVALFLVLSLSALAWSEETPSDKTFPVPAPEKSANETAPAVQPAEQADEQPAEQAAVQTAIQIKDTVVCEDVVDRAPVGSSDVFPKESAKLYCFSRVVGGLAETEITHNWYYKGTLKSSVKLAVRSNNWRTWSSKALTPEWTGEWMVEILSDEGTPLESIIFFVQ